MRYCFVRQDGIKDCGVACLLMIIRTYKGGCSKEYLRNLTNTTKDGTTAFDLMRAGEKFHFTTFGLRGKVENLEEAYFPVIAHVVKDKSYQHFVVIYKLDKVKRELIIADPAIGIQKVSVEEFEKISTNQFIIFLQNTTILKIDNKHPIYHDLKKFLFQNYKSFWMVIIFSFLYTLFSIMVTFCLQFFLDYVLVTYELSLFLAVAFIFVMITILKSLFQYIRFRSFIYFTQKFNTYLFENIYHHLFLLPDSYYRNRTTGELLARITDLGDLQNTIGKFLMNVVMDSIFAIFSLIVLFFLHPQLTLMLLLFVFFDFLLFFVLRKRIRRSIILFKEEYAKFHSYLVDTIGAISSIRHVACESYIEKRFHEKQQQQVTRSIAYQNCWNMQILLKNLNHGISHILLISLGCYLIFQQKLSVSSLMSYLFLTSFFLNPLESIYDFLLDYQDSKEAFNRVEEFYQVEEERIVKDQDISEIQSLEVQHLSYSYCRNSPVLVDLNLSFYRGEKILIYGNSGCGKSTLIKILAGYLEATAGNIHINGKQLDFGKIQLLRKYITYVSQEETLLNMSLRDNILLGRDIPEEKFSYLCKILSIDDFVSKNVLTYDMPIEEDGNNLSGGERQRVILARSLLKNSDIYILDESLCNMDVSLERKVLENMFRYLEDKIVIVVSHRFYNADLYDRKIELLKGGEYAENYNG